MLPFKNDDPFAEPEGAARELIRICKAEMEATNRSFACTGSTNYEFWTGWRSTVAS
jgi:hypothetical protein